MARDRSKFAGGDQRYLREEQYADSSRLAARAQLHAKYRTAPESWVDWEPRRFDLAPGCRVLEVGCGAGWMWSETHVPVPPDVILTLTDLSPGMVAEASARAEATSRFVEVRAEVADAQSLPFADASFDRVISNHMLYHLPDPARGVAELARLLASGGRAIVATNGRRHMQELWAMRAQVFGESIVDQTVDVFGIETGFPILRDHFGSVAWSGYADVLRCTDQGDVIAYVCSSPPGEDAPAAQRDHLADLVAEAFDAGGGAMLITKDTGCFVCTEPLTPLRS